MEDQIFEITLHDLYGLGCERWELASRFNHEEDAE